VTNLPSPLAEPTRQEPPRRPRRAALIAVAGVAVAVLVWALVAHLTGDSRARAIQGQASSCGLGARYDWSTLKAEGARRGALGGTEYLYVVALASNAGGPAQLRHFVTDAEDPPVVGTEDMDPVWLHACAASHPVPYPSAAIAPGTQ
jgi:hypothetical protein